MTPDTLFLVLSVAAWAAWIWVVVAMWNANNEDEE